MAGAVLFDLDETLLDRRSSLRRFLADQHARFFASGRHVSVDDYCTRFLALDRRGLVPKSVVYPACSRNSAPRRRWRRTCFKTTRSGAACSRADFPVLWRPSPACARGVSKLGIVTNGQTEFQDRHIDALDLRRRVDAILISEAEGLRKPDARLFHRAAERLGIAPKACLFVGDNSEADILGAHDAGLQTAWFANGHSWPGGFAPLPGRKIDRLPDLLGIVDDLKMACAG